MLRNFWLTLGAWMCLATTAFGTTEHLLISEVAYNTANESASASSEFVEIFNPTSQTIDLSTYYISDAPDKYALISDFNYSNNQLILLSNNADWIYKFPNGLSIPPGGVIVICQDAQSFVTEFFGGTLSGFTSLPGSPQLVQTNPSGLAGVATMVARSTYSSTSQTPSSGLSMTNSGEVVIVFRWDGQSDLITDIDTVYWGSALTQSPPLNLNKAIDFAAGIDGPDSDVIRSNFNSDAGAIASFAGPVVASSPVKSIVRPSLIESSEAQTGGNGVNGHDESSEDVSAFTQETPSPGTCDLGQPELSLSPGDLDFGRVAAGAVTSLSLQIENKGTKTLVIHGFAISGTNASEFNTTATTLTIPVGQSDTVQVTFSPTALSQRSATLTISNNDPSRGSLAVQLRGTGETAPALEVGYTPANGSAVVVVGANDTFTFPATHLSLSATLDVRIANTGGADLQVTAITLAGSHASDFAIDTAAAVVQSSTPLTRTITFSPTDQGPRSATLTLTTNDPNNSTLILSLEGDGLPAPTPIAQVDATKLVFATIAPNARTEQGLLVLNAGTGELNIPSLSLTGIDAASFEVVTAPTVVVAAGDSQSIVVRFRPTSAGSKQATLTLSTNDTTNASIDVNLQGVAITAKSGGNGSGGGCRLEANTSQSSMAIWLAVLGLLAFVRYGRATG